MKNIKIYKLMGLISFIAILPSFFENSNIFNVLSSIGCSGLAASIMAIIIEQRNDKEAENRFNNARTLLFKEINLQYNMLFERILWFDTKMKDPDFNWELSPLEYSSLKYRLYIDMIDPTSRREVKLSFKEAERRLFAMGSKYNLEAQEKMTEEELLKTQKMFGIIAASCNYLLLALDELYTNRIALAISEYLPTDRLDSLANNTHLAIEIMKKPKKNYSTAIKLLVVSAKRIKEIGHFDDTIQPGLNGSMCCDEL